MFTERAHEPLQPERVLLKHGKETRRVNAVVSKGSLELSANMALVDGWQLAGKWIIETWKGARKLLFTQWCLENLKVQESQLGTINAG